MKRAAGRRVLVFLACSLGVAACGGRSAKTSGSGDGDGPEAGAGGTTAGTSGSGTGGFSGSTTGGTAGIAQGGEPTGGTSGTAGASGSSGSTPTGGTTSTGGTSGVPLGVCTRDEDCTLSTDCCSCFAAAPGEATQICRRACTPETTACALEGTSNVRCNHGRCVLERMCDTRSITCDAVPPECPSGSVPSVINGCYGPCTPVNECMYVTSCAMCDSAGLACVATGFVEGEYYACVSTPPECAPNPTCECMKVCQNELFCADPEGTSLNCFCPAC